MVNRCCDRRLRGLAETLVAFGKTEDEKGSNAADMQQFNAEFKGEKMKLLVRWAIVSLSLFVATWLVPGIRVEPNAWFVYAVMAVILGLVNAVVRPALKFLSCPLIILTLGLFVLVINGLTLWLASSIAVNWLHVGFYVEGFWPAFLGALVVSIVSVILSALLTDAD
jgi:putative membrane protein